MEGIEKEINEMERIEWDYIRSNGIIAPASAHAKDVSLPATDADPFFCPQS